MPLENVGSCLTFIICKKIEERDSYCRFMKYIVNIALFYGIINIVKDKIKKLIPGHIQVTVFLDFVRILILF